MNKGNTVLMCLMKMDIGGAETHVVVLSHHLVQLGYRVIVASNGGVFEKQLADYGVNHYRVPLHNSKPLSIIRSLQGLHRIMARENVDIVHAHARIPALLVSLLGVPQGAHFLTTAHSNFQGLSWLSRWGEKTIAVSDDIKDYLINYFKVAPEKIVVIPNGIDTDKFHPAVRSQAGTGQTKITMVSRLDGTLATVATDVIAAAEKLYKLHPGLQLQIVGDGDNIDAVREKARELNEEAGRALVTLTGARSDVDRLIAGSDLVVGVSRVALEAMASAKPVVLTGPQGFGGLIEQANIKEFQKDNFTCRTSGQYSSVENMAAALTRFFSKSMEWRTEIGNASRKLVQDEYDSLVMAKQVARVYEELRKG